MKTCFECGAEATEEHHVIPRSRGGTKTVSLCSTCHGLVHNTKRTDSISQLTKEAFARKKARGEILGGRPAYGYKRLENHVRGQDATEQNIIFIMRVLKTRGFSASGISCELESNGFLNRDGQPFGTSAVYKITKGIKARPHKWKPRGKRPYGYRNNGALLEKDSTEQNIAFIARLLRARGFKIREIAATMAKDGFRNRAGNLVGPQNIYPMVKGIKKGRRKDTVTKKAEAVRGMIESGVHYSSVAKSLSVSVGTVYRYMAITKTKGAIHGTQENIRVRDKEI